ncbi:hypothetical protein K0U00_49230, partial [Paenibacillus sepulcri]|nr:hypothetical protein [Paenibacillus sepulcri]
AFMDGALPRSQTALMWTAEASAEGWADGLINNQIPFDVLLQEQATLERLSQYGALIIPGGMNLTEDWVAVLTTYVKQGGNIVIEGIVPEQEELLALLGISGEASVSEPLTASYLRFEGDSNPLQKGMET